MWYCEILISKTFTEWLGWNFSIGQIRKKTALPLWLMVGFWDIFVFEMLYPNGWQMKMWQTFIGCCMHRDAITFWYVNKCSRSMVGEEKIDAYIHFSLWLSLVHSFRSLHFAFYLAISVWVHLYVSTWACASVHFYFPFFFFSTLWLKRIFELISTLFHTKWAKVSSVLWRVSAYSFWNKKPIKIFSLLIQAVLPRFFLQLFLFLSLFLALCVCLPLLSHSHLACFLLYVRFVLVFLANFCSAHIVALCASILLCNRHRKKLYERLLAIRTIELHLHVS